MKKGGKEVYKDEKDTVATRKLFGKRG